MTPSPILAIWSSSSANGRRNLQRGLDTQTWGFKDDHSDYHRPIDYVIFGYEHSAGSPRLGPQDWQRGSATLILCQRTVAPYLGHAPHWPDEHNDAQVIYPYRFGLTPLATLTDVPLSQAGPLAGAGSEALRLSAIGNRGIRTETDLTDLMAQMGLVFDPTGNPDLSQTAGAVTPDTTTVRGRRGAGRSNDAAFNRAVETHAVQMATTHLQAQGWDVDELGKPYDLVCTKPDGTEKHIEVKGTTGAGAEVQYTPNEVNHFRTCPHGADLIVVRDIVVDRTATPYATSGGQLTHITNYTAPPTDLQATGWLGRVDQW